eukprot:6208414-Pleurochrysis_carterae.AAC.8
MSSGRVEVHAASASARAMGSASEQHTATASIEGEADEAERCRPDDGNLVGGVSILGRYADWWTGRADASCALLAGGGRVSSVPSVGASHASIVDAK